MRVKIICEIIILSEPAKKQMRKFRVYCCTTNVNIPPTAIPNNDGIGFGFLHMRFQKALHHMDIVLRLLAADAVAGAGDPGCL